MMSLNSIASLMTNRSVSTSLFPMMNSGLSSAPHVWRMAVRAGLFFDADNTKQAINCRSSTSLKLNGRKSSVSLSGCTNFGRKFRFRSQSKSWARLTTWTSTSSKSNWIYTKSTSIVMNNPPSSAFFFISSRSDSSFVTRCSLSHRYAPRLRHELRCLCTERMIARYRQCDFATGLNFWYLGTPIAFSPEFGSGDFISYLFAVGEKTEKSHLKPNTLQADDWHLIDVCETRLSQLPFMLTVETKKLHWTRSQSDNKASSSLSAFFDSCPKLITRSMRHRKWCGRQINTQNQSTQTNYRLIS